MGKERRPGGLIELSWCGLGRGRMLVGLIYLRGNSELSELGASDIFSLAIDVVLPGARLCQRHW